MLKQWNSKVLYLENVLFRASDCSLLRYKSKSPLFYPAGVLANFFHKSSYLRVKDYYSVLAVPRNASVKDIKKAYIELAKKYHPDANSGNANAATKFQEIADAYSVLSSKEGRAKYDNSMNEDSKDFDAVRRSTNYSKYESFHSSVDPEELFRKIFGTDFREDFVNKGNRGWIDYAGSDYTQTEDTVVRLSFKEAALGCEKVVTAKTLSICEKCVGIGCEPGRPLKLCSFCDGLGFETFDTISGKVKTTCRFCHGKGHLVVHKCSNCMGYGRTMVDRDVIIPVPIGITDGETVKIAIHPSTDDQAIGTSGIQTVFIRFRVEPSNYFSVDGFDLHSSADITLTKAVLGGTISIEGLYDIEKIKIKAGTDSHSTHKLTAKGLKKTSGSGYGDHYVHIKIVVPKKLTVEQISLLKTFEDENSPNEKKDSRALDFPNSNNFFRKLWNWVVGRG